MDEFHQQVLLPAALPPCIIQAPCSSQSKISKRRSGPITSCLRPLISLRVILNETWLHYHNLPGPLHLVWLPSGPWLQDQFPWATQHLRPINLKLIWTATALSLAEDKWPQLKWSGNYWGFSMKSQGHPCPAWLAGISLLLVPKDSAYFSFLFQGTLLFLSLVDFLLNPTVWLPSGTSPPSFPCCSHPCFSKGVHTGPSGTWLLLLISKETRQRWGSWHKNLIRKV